jgi:hypothetical protein
MSRTKYRLSGVVRALHKNLLIGLVAFGTTTAYSQSGSPAQGGSTAANSDLPSAPDPIKNVPNTTSYQFPDGKQQFHNYLNATFGPIAFVRAAVGAGLDQSKPAPPEWGTGAEGYEERYGFRLGMGMITETTKYSAGALLHEDVAYHKCMCVGFVPRTAHVFVSPFVAKARTGRTILSVPSIAAPYAGSFAAVSAWYPSRYESQFAARLGSFSFALSIGANLVREFVLPGR